MYTYFYIISRHSCSVIIHLSCCPIPGSRVPCPLYVYVWIPVILLFRTWIKSFLSSSICFICGFLFCYNTSILLPRTWIKSFLSSSICFICGFLFCYNTSILLSRTWIKSFLSSSICLCVDSCSAFTSVFIGTLMLTRSFLLQCNKHAQCIDGSGYSMRNVVYSEEN